MREKNELKLLYILGGLGVIWGVITIVSVLVEFVKVIIKR